jgi:methionyl-tRNA formyltransferase
VYGVVTEPIGPAETSGDLLARLASSGARLLVATLDGIEDGSLVAVPQPADGVSIAPKLTPDDVRIDWGTPSLHVDRLVRAATPAPGAWTTFRGRRLKVLPVIREPSAAPLAPGELAGELAGTADVPVRLGRVQPEGKAVMDAAAWLRGVRPEPGERLG